MRVNLAVSRIRGIPSSTPSIDAHFLLQMIELRSILLSHWCLFRQGLDRLRFCSVHQPQAQPPLWVVGVGKLACDWRPRSQRAFRCLLGCCVSVFIDDSAACFVFKCCTSFAERLLCLISDAVVGYIDWSWSIDHRHDVCAWRNVVSWIPKKLLFHSECPYVFCTDSCQANFMRGC